MSAVQNIVSAYMRGADSADVTSVNSSASTVTLFAARPAARSRSIFNASTQILYVKKGASASSTDYSFYLTAGQYWENPSYPPYRGVMTGVWASANGAAKLSEDLD